MKELRDNTPNLPDSVRLSLHKNDNDTLLHEKFPSMNNSASGSAIPDSSAILAAKKKREQMRKGFNITDNDDGFISLNDMDEEDDVCIEYILDNNVIKPFVFIEGWL